MAIVEIRDVSKAFAGVKVLDSVSLDIKPGERIAMMGPNGAGKTTLVRAMLGFYRTDSGTITIDGYNPMKERVKVLENISFIPQTPPPVRLNIDELVKYVERSSGTDREEIFAEASRMDLDLGSQLNKPFFKLSGGMKQKLLIAIALSKKSDLLVFDEPTANLDPKGREQFYHLLSEIDSSFSTLFITHRLDEIKGLVNRQIYMDLGKVVDDEAVV
jgi:ABC-2 type transport system ATP-binding protein